MRDARFRAEREPQRARPDGDQHDNRHENACDAVGHALHRSLRTLRGSDERHNLRKHRILTDFRGTIPQCAGLIDGGAGYIVTDFFGDRHGFAGNHGFVDA